MSTIFNREFALVEGEKIALPRYAGSELDP
jgi:hypothetical protein